MDVDLNGEESLIAELDSIEERWFANESKEIVIADTSYAVFSLNLGRIRKEIQDGGATVS